MINFDYTRVATTKGAINEKTKYESSQFIAGGTNLVDLMKKGVTTPQRLIDINGLPLKQITSDTKGINIGALSLNSMVAENEMIKSKFPLVSQALQAGASAQLRNMATVGGNMMQRTRCTYFYDTTLPCNKRNPGSGCGALEGYNRMHAIFGASEKCIAVHPSDMCVALSALNATVIINGSKGERRINFSNFHRLPGDTPEVDNNLKNGELITGIHIPFNKFNRNHYLKFRDRASYAFALVSVAGALEFSKNTIQSAALSMGGVAHKPWRLMEVEQFLKGKTASPGVFEEAASLAFRDAKIYKYNSFKIKLGQAALVETLRKLTS